MLLVLSPAKALDFSAAPPGAPLTQPQFSDETATLVRAARRLTLRDLKGLMSISDSLAKLNRERFAAFDLDTEDGLQAAFAFNGDVYKGLRAREFNRETLRFAGDRLRILSGLYGLLRPFDAIQPYRLEMGSRLKTRRGADLYSFWGAKIAEALQADLAGHADPVVINLASQEYARAIDTGALARPMVACHFREEHDGETRMVSFFAKKARGLMARFALDHRLDDREGLKAFDLEGYRFDAASSTDTEFNFVRPAA